MSRFAADQQRLDAFALALQAEQDALQRGQTDELATLADQKLAAGEAFQRLASPGLVEALKDAGQRLRLGQTLADGEVLALHRGLSAARELNLINGALIDQHLAQVRLRLSRIAPVHPTRQVYGRNGLGNSVRPGRSFGAV